MLKISWDKFGLQAEGKQESFEDLCMFLFCRELKIEKIDAYHNQPGLETEPVKVNGKNYGFQSKFFSSKFDWEQIKHSISGKEDKDCKSDDLRKKYPDNVFERYKLNELYIYSNKPKTSNGRKKTEADKFLNKLAREYSAKIIYICGKSFTNKLLIPSNYDLALYYFNIGDTLNFILNSVDKKRNTFILSSEFMPLPVIDSSNEDILISDNTFFSDNKVVLLLGHPGSGKSIYMHKILAQLGGLEKTNKRDMLNVLTGNNSVPVLINLKNCFSGSLENMLRERQNDCMVNNREFNFTYLFDGLDELTETTAENVLHNIYELSQKQNTQGIIISCRSGNPNRLKAKNSFPEITEIKIKNLTIKNVDAFFENKQDSRKKEQLRRLKKGNLSLIQSINDILLIKLFWETIEELNKTSLIIDLFEKKIALLLSDPVHKKHLDRLNILNPKAQNIVELNKEISFLLQKEFQYRFNISELQEMLLKRFPRLDYQSVNEIVNYMTALFFDCSYDNQVNNESSYIYQHRRYQEFFFIQKLQEEYEKNPNIIRELKFIANQDFFENLFLQYLRKKYQQENDLPGLIELNLIDVYLGKHSGWGANLPGYKSGELIHALAKQKKYIFNELLEDENLHLKEKIFVNVDKLRKKIEELKKDKKNFRLVDSLKNVWSNELGYLIRNVKRLWELDKFDTAQEFIIQVNEIFDFIFADDFFQEFKDNLRGDPCLDNPSEFLYYKLVICNENINDIFEQFVRGNYSYNNQKELFGGFVSVCLEERKDQFIGIMDSFDDDEFIILLEILSSVDYLHIFIRDESLQSKIRERIISSETISNIKNVYILFYKKYFETDLTKDEIVFAESKFGDLLKERSMDFDHNNKYEELILLSFILNKYDFENLLEKSCSLNEKLLCCALFKEYINFLRNDKTIAAIIRDYTRCANKRIKDGQTNWLQGNQAALLTKFFINEDNPDFPHLRALKKMLLKEEYDVHAFIFYNELSKSNIFPKITIENDIKQFEKKLTNWDEDFSGYVDWCYSLSVFFADINPAKAKYYFSKGITEEILRHGWRKDYIVDHNLIKAFEIIWKNGWLPEQDLKDYVTEILKLSIRVEKITDDADNGAHNLIKMLSIYDIELAEQVKGKYIQSNRYKNNELVTLILKSKISKGFSFDEIESQIKNDYKNNQYNNCFVHCAEQKFFVYLELSSSPLYTEDQNKKAFEEAFKIVEEMKNERYFLLDANYKTEKTIYQGLCEKFEKNFHLEFNKHDALNTVRQAPENQIDTADAFIEELKACTNEKQLSGIYDGIGAAGDNKEYWEIIISKTFEICGDIKLFTDFLSKNKYPHTDFWTGSSKILYIPVAIAIKNINTRQEIFDYLSKNSGHGGFLHIMQSYELLRDKDMCLKLFERFMKFCKLLVY